MQADIENEKSEVTITIDDFWRMAFEALAVIEDDDLETFADMLALKLFGRLE